VGSGPAADLSGVRSQLLVQAQVGAFVEQVQVTGSQK